MKYLRRKACLPHDCICIILFLLIAIFGFEQICDQNGENNSMTLWWFIVILIVIETFNVLGSLFYYAFNEEGIIKSYGFIAYKKICFSDIKTIIIANAVYNDALADPNAGTIPQYDRQTKRRLASITVLFTPEKEIELVGTEDARDIIRMYPDGSNIGICWFGALQVLLIRTKAQVIVSEAVYERFRDEFEGIFNGCDAGRLRIVKARG